MGNQNNDDDWDDIGQQQKDAIDQQDQNSRSGDNFNDNGGTDCDNDLQEKQQPKEDIPPGTEDGEPANNEPSSFEPSECFDDNNQSASNAEDCGDGGDGNGEESAAGNTTPLCDEEAKD